LIRFFNLLLSLIGGFLPALFGEDHSKSLAQPFPFEIGERLEYNMKWGFFPVGSASMELLASEPSVPDGAKLLRFQVRTNSFADKFYKVRTSVSSTIDPFFTRTLRYEKIQHEGSKYREIVVEYDYKNKVARYRQKGQSEMVTEIPGPVFDPLSIAYFFRLHPLVQNGERRLPTCDGKKFREVIVKAGRREKIKLPGGEIYAVPTTPEMENLGGVFNKSPKGMLEVWYSDDQRRVPVRISSKVVVGSFTATLVKASPPLF
jgi:hypothetical protein